MGERRTMNLSGKLSQIFQHEIDHFLGRYIFEDDIMESIAEIMEKDKKKKEK
jgi:peptide deformylase